MLSDSETVKLTEFAHGAGCGCKIAPGVLKEILKEDTVTINHNKLLVGNESSDDAAVYDLGDGQGLIATTDFFMPVVDDAFDFGRVAAANAISDVYAMGGKPIMALALLGWPVQKLAPSLAAQVMAGAKAVCAEAGIPLGGGHSIDNPEPLFGLAVNGLIKIKDLKRNNTAREGDHIFITKQIGTGILTTAQKRKVLKEADRILLVEQLTQLNSLGEKLAGFEGVSAMTDITGFGLLGHLMEMAEGSGLTAVINYETVPKFESLSHYIGLGTIPDATFKNWNNYSPQVHFAAGVNMAEAFSVLPDPQTNGGLMFTVSERALEQVVALMESNGLKDFAKPIGRMQHREEKVIKVEK